MSARHAFIEHFFESAFRITDVRRRSEIDDQSLFNFLERLHSTADKLFKRFGRDIHNVPEFILLSLIRNYVHHADDVIESWVTVAEDDRFLPPGSFLIVIPASDVAKAISNYREREGSSPRR